MNLHSMTGFGEATREVDGVRATATLRSVNHKQLDVRVSLPTSLASLETAVARDLKARLGRGRIDARISVSSIAAPVADSAVAPELAALVATLRAVQERFELDGGLSVSDVVRAGGAGLLTAAREPGPEVSSPAVHAALGDALEALVAFRVREGAGLHAFFVESVGSLEEILERVETLAGAAIAHHRAALARRVDDVLASRDAGRIDAERLEHEIVLIAERSDIAEELQRARAHLSALRQVLDDAAAGAHGKRVDFLLQEMIRETNTMASKSVSAELTHQVVEAKAIVERMREQAHNVE